MISQQLSSVLPLQEVFAHAAFSTLKTMVMMIGEIDFGDLFGAGVSFLYILYYIIYYKIL